MVFISPSAAESGFTTRQRLLLLLAFLVGLSLCALSGCPH